MKTIAAPVVSVAALLADCAMHAQESADGMGAASAEALVREPRTQELIVPNREVVDDNDSNVFTRTIVAIHEDGTSTSSSGPITRAEQRLEVARRLAAQTSDGTQRFEPDAVFAGCSTSYYTVLYSQPNYAGNELCLYNDSTTPVAVDLYVYRQTRLLTSPTWFTCDAGYLHRIGGPCGGPGQSAVQSYISYASACFSQKNTTTATFAHYNISGANPSAGASVSSDEFLWLSQNGVHCTTPIYIFE